MLFEIVLYVQHRKAGRVSVEDGEIVAVVENGRKRTPRSKSFNEAADYIMNETDLEPVGQPVQIGKGGYLTTYRHTYRKPGVYIQARYDRWAVAYPVENHWMVGRAGKDTETRFRTKAEAMSDVDAHVGIDYMAELHKKTVDKDFETMRAKYLREERERKEKRDAMSAEELSEKAAKGRIMKKWKRGQRYGTYRTEIVDTDGGRAIATVWTHEPAGRDRVEPWPEGEANLNLVLAAPDLLKACRAAFVYVDSIIQFQEMAGKAVAEDTIEVHAMLEAVLDELGVDHD